MPLTTVGTARDERSVRRTVLGEPEPLLPHSHPEAGGGGLGHVTSSCLQNQYLQSFNRTFTNLPSHRHVTVSVSPLLRPASLDA